MGKGKTNGWGEINRIEDTILYNVVGTVKNKKRTFEKRPLSSFLIFVADIKSNCVAKVQLFF
ncbi:hypothetical protein AGMMS50239_10560 [Bacteroidia bacterium]|nr:hypothetical protein AGMMS50239_10560 [Bacteroidia bacterium]